MRTILFVVVTSLVFGCGKKAVSAKLTDQEKAEKKLIESVKTKQKQEFQEKKFKYLILVKKNIQEEYIVLNTCKKILKIIEIMDLKINSNLHHEDVYSLDSALTNIKRISDIETSLRSWIYDLENQKNIDHLIQKVERDSNNLYYQGIRTFIYHLKQIESLFKKDGENYRFGKNSVIQKKLYLEVQSVFTEIRGCSKFASYLKRYDKDIADSQKDQTIQTYKNWGFGNSDNVKQYMEKLKKKNQVPSEKREKNRHEN